MEKCRLSLPQGVDVGHKQRKVIRREPKSNDPYILLLVKVSTGFEDGLLLHQWSWYSIVSGVFVLLNAH